jgi:uncharacterized repeat protein (TIGR02543 family)
MVLSLITAIPITAHADDSYDAVIDVVNGTGTGDGWTYESGEIWINESGSYFISGDGIQTSNRIQVKAGITAAVTLDDVNINTVLPFNCGDNSNVTVVLVDNSENIFSGGGAHAGLRVAPTATLTITTAGQSIGNGSLSAQGGEDNSSNWASAGIGGSQLEQSGTIVINGGTVYAKGGNGRPSGTWTGPGGAGIGGASGRACGDITINGGNVTAFGGDVNPEGAGIGGGSSDPSTYIGKITINGGRVRAYSGQTGTSGTGIGFCSAIAIADAADVNAYSSGNYPAIYGTTDTTGHSAFLLNFMLDASVSQDTDITITQKDDSGDNFQLMLPNGYKNLAATVGTSNNYTGDLSDGSKKIVALSDEGTEFPGIWDSSGTALSSYSVKLKANPVCMINSTEYETLDSALANVTFGQTIKLLTDITHNSRIKIDSNGFDLTLDLNGHTLTVEAPSSCIEIHNSSNISVIDSVGDGMLIANTTGDGAIALRAESYGNIMVDAPLTINAMSSNSRGIRTYAAGSVTVTDAEINASKIGVESYGDWNYHQDASTITVTGNITMSGDSTEYGAYAYSGGEVTINGDVEGANTGLCSDGGTLTVTGDVSGNTEGVRMYSDGGNITVTGNVSSPGNYSYGILASGGTIAVTGNVSANGSNAIAVCSNGSGSVMVGGNVNATGTSSFGAEVWDNSSVKIDGIINATGYVSIAGTVKGPGDTYEPTKLAGYYTYANSSNLLNYVLVKGIYQVTFDTQGGSTIESVTTGYNTEITSPTEPTRTGYTFGGWYKEAACTNAWNFATDKVTTATTLFAKWIPNPFMVTFNTQGGNTIGSVTTGYDTAITAPPAPTRSGYNFGGWYKESACTDDWDFTTDKVTSATTLYAKWAPNTYTVKFNTNGGKGTMPSLSLAYNTSKTLTANAFKKTGYSFLGWAKTPTGAVVYKDKTSVKNLTAANRGTINLYAKWGPPILEAKSQNYTSIKISWAYAGSATSYKVYRATRAKGTYSLVHKATSTARSWIDRGQKTGKTYYYKVYPVAGGKTYKFSTYKSAKAVPTAPTVKAFKYTTSSAKITWTGVAGATKYKIYRATSSTGMYSLVYTASSKARSWVNTGRAVGKTYYYKVRAYHLEGKTKVYGSYSSPQYVRF